MSDIIVSVVIVNYRVPQHLRQTLRSLSKAELFELCEVIVVDNASRDGSKEKILTEFTFVKWIELKTNAGFGKACNVGAQQARGKYLLFLNPDTLVSHNTLVEFINFYEQHTNVGIVGPKTLNHDGTLQKSCRRSFPTPAVAFYHFSGLSRLFPKSRRFGRYNLTYLDPDKAAKVDAISGCCMFMTLKLFRDIGGFDEQFFMYGEDLDLCARVGEKGLQVWYLPTTQIIHLKGKSSSLHPLRSKWAFYEAMIIFSKKYSVRRSSFFPSWLIFIGIVLQAAIHLTANLAKSLIAVIIDLLVINVGLWLSVMLRFKLFNLVSPYQCSDALRSMLLVHSLLTVTYLFVLSYRGVYSKERYTPSNALISAFIASIIFLAEVYFIKQIAFSRILYAFSSLGIPFLLVGWRKILPKTIRKIRQWMYSTGNVIVIGDGYIAAMLIQNIETDPSAVICGILWPTQENMPGEFMGYPVLGTIEDVRTVLEKERVDLLVIATAYPWYTQIIRALSSSKRRNFTIRWVPHELFTLNPEQIPKNIPLEDFAI